MFISKSGVEILTDTSDPSEMRLTIIFDISSENKSNISIPLGAKYLIVFKKRLFRLGLLEVIFDITRSRISSALEPIHIPDSFIDKFNIFTESIFSLLSKVYM
ncbi:hypothetical protein AYI70_g1426 [Smittium culicis]|uniref:Uncharacterized protein n=1 Tax=Smittium culicis TaxID=133412 RepID=A0A1R1YDB3_9FUNG|nr:hypothetical protein AYI70_g1426 [Smittium culicis]